MPLDLLQTFILDQQNQATEGRKALAGAKANELGFARGNLTNQRAVQAAKALAAAKLRQSQGEIKGRAGVALTGKGLANEGNTIDENKALVAGQALKEFVDKSNALSSAQKGRLVDGGKATVESFGPQSKYTELPPTIGDLANVSAALSGGGVRRTHKEVDKFGDPSSERGHRTVSEERRYFEDPGVTAALGALASMMNKKLGIAVPQQQRMDEATIRELIANDPDTASDYSDNPDDFVIAPLNNTPGAPLALYRISTGKWFIVSPPATENSFSP